MSLRDARREYREIPIAAIDPPRLASRATMDEAQLEELARDIARNGVISPLSVGRVGDRYEVVAGHRRLMAASRARLAAVPCVVYASVDAAHEAIKFAENKYREDLNPADEALWFTELLERDCGGDVDRLCEQLGIKRSYAENRLLLLTGDEQIFEAVQRGAIGVGVAQQLNRCTDEGHRRMLLRSAIDGGATQALVSGWILDWQKAQRYLEGAPAPGQGAAPLAPLPQTNYFTCYVCKGTEHVETMRPINIHGHCALAILDKALEQYGRRGDQLLAPRTVDEARSLIAQLLEQFPDLLVSNN